MKYYKKPWLFLNSLNLFSHSLRISKYPTTIQKCSHSTLRNQLRCFFRNLALSFNLSFFSDVLSDYQSIQQQFKNILRIIWNPRLVKKFKTFLVIINISNLSNFFHSFRVLNNISEIIHEFFVILIKIKNILEISTFTIFPEIHSDLLNICQQFISTLRNPVRKIRTNWGSKIF